jgi:hypothetical protein
MADEALAELFAIFAVADGKSAPNVDADEVAIGALSEHATIPVLTAFGAAATRGSTAR